MFFGRTKELEQLREFKNRNIAGMIVCSGRRRIGKSTLIEHFGKETKFFEFYGLAPRENLSNKNQLDHFGEQLGLNFNLPPIKFDNWNQALETLAGLTTQGPITIFLDEISWMAGKDKDFAGKLKGVWDTKFKKNNELLLIICGSVSSWIQDNILNDKGFVGRVSLVLNLQEMPLHEANNFWGKRLISSHEKFKILCVTGGVPRYLEEIQPNHTAEQNIKKMCFSQGGVLVEEFNKIFRDIFEKKEQEYCKIINELVNGSLEMSELCQRLGIKQTGGFTKQMNTLVISGFVSKDYVWNENKKHLKTFKFRLKDNYLRFYLKYIKPKKELIDQGIFHDLFLEDLPGLETILGLQFENLVLNNLPSIIHLLKIPTSSVISASPYFQKATKKKQACQIDLLIQTKHTLYICEIKFRKKIAVDVIDEITKKIQTLKISKTISIRPVLIYEGELAPTINQDNFFSHIISFCELLKNS
ncbi:MAG: ATP-binding protein [Chlamydiota bacterium]